MREAVCPICQAKLLQYSPGWGFLWVTQRQTFRCPSCATMLAWNYRRMFVPAFALWTISFLPFAYYGNTHVGMWSDEENGGFVVFWASAPS